MERAHRPIAGDRFLKNRGDDEERFAEVTDRGVPQFSAYPDDVHFAPEA